MTDDELMKYAILFLTVILNVSGQYNTENPGTPDTAAVVNALKLDPSAASDFLTKVKSGTTSDAIKSVALALAVATPYQGPGCPKTTAPIVKVANKYLA